MSEKNAPAPAPASSLDIPNETLRSLLSLGAAAPKVFGADDSEPLVSLPANQQLVSLAKFMPPKYINRVVNLLDAPSYAEYINRFKTPNSLIFANIQTDAGDSAPLGVEFTAFLDYHAPAPDLTPARCAHLAKFHALLTPEWLVWDGADGNCMTQVKFAEFCEENAELFVCPSGADLLELVRSLEGHKNARFNSSFRLDNGAHSCAYDEEVVVKGATTTVNGALELPKTIQAGIAVFFGSDPYAVTARLKVRVEDRKLALWYETVNRPKIVRESIMALVKQVADATGILPLLAQP